jgi:hypothetical protein
MAFCKEYNAATAKMAGDIIPVEITVYEVRQVDVAKYNGETGERIPTSVLAAIWAATWDTDGGGHWLSAQPEVCPAAASFVVAGLQLLYVARGSRRRFCSGSRRGVRRG